MYNFAGSRLGFVVLFLSTSSEPPVWPKHSKKRKLGPNVVYGFLDRPSLSAGARLVLAGLLYRVQPYGPSDKAISVLFQKSRIRLTCVAHNMARNRTNAKVFWSKSIKNAMLEFLYIKFEISGTIHIG